MAELLTECHLPSRGLLNPGQPQYAGPIMLDMIGLEQEKILYGSTVRNGLRRVMEQLIKTEGIKIEDLTRADEQYLLVQERIHSYGDEYHVTGKCPQCGMEEEFKVNISEMEIIELPKTFSEPIVGKLPMDGSQVGVRKLRISDFDAIEREARQHAEKRRVNPESIEFELRMLRTIETIEGEKANRGEKREFISKLRGRDLAYIQWLANKDEFGYSNTFYVTCSSCGEEYKVPFRLTSEFFRPRFD